MENLAGSLLLAYGFLFTFFVPGYVLIEGFYSYLPRIQKLPLYMLVSVLLSTWSIFLTSYIFGYSRLTIILTFALFLPGLFWVILRRNIKHLYPKKHLMAVVLALIALILFVVALYPAIFYQYHDYIVMSADNWQDTAMHMGIIQSISQGNFPPQAPYYSGRPLTYYYFSDFHTAILQTLTTNFAPRILVLDNALYVFIFSLGVYALSYLLTKNRKSSLFASLIALFTGNFMYIRLITDLAKPSTEAFLVHLKNLISTGAYTMEYGKLMQMTPVTDYFLQNRPMMVGLPSVVLIVILAIGAYKQSLLLRSKKNDASRLFLAGLITGFLVKFQLFSFIVSSVLVGISFLIFLGKRGLSKKVAGMVGFLGISLLFLTILVATGDPDRSFVDIFKNSFSLGPWDKTKDLLWYLKFYIANFNLPFIIGVIFIPFVIFKKSFRKKEYLFLVAWFLIMLLTPQVVRFTIYEGDMFKFYYFMMIPLGIFSGIFLTKLLKNPFGEVIVTLFLLGTFLTAAITLLSSFSNKNYAYSLDDLKAGLWIRNNTPKNSVFATYPTVHSAATQIGGRLRVLSYINWPYSHGFNTGPDNVFARVNDLESLYNNAQDVPEVNYVLGKYNIDYSYLGPEEKNRYPTAASFFDQTSNLRRVYSDSSIVIYKVN